MQYFFNAFDFARWQILILLFILLPETAVTQLRAKSALVQDLETIFYNASFAAAPDTTFSVKDYGAIGDGKTCSTGAIQSVLDAVAEAGGGVVLSPPGTYVTGALFVRSNTELRIDKEVVIQTVQGIAGEGTFDTYNLVKLAKDNGFDGLFGLQCYNIKQDAEVALTKSINTWRSYQKR